MSFEKLAILGIAVFGFMALVQAFSAARAVKRSAKRNGTQRPRRQVGSEVVAMGIAEGLVGETIMKYPELTNEARESGVIPKELETALDKTMLHYKERVLPRFKGLFYVAINRVVLGREPGKSLSDDSGMSVAREDEDV